MTDPTTAFFTSLGEHGRFPLLGSVTGTIRFDLTGHGGRGEHWRIAINRGHVDISRGEQPADCVVKVDKTLFDGMVTGTVNTMAATLRGQVDVDGDLHLITMLQRLFPGRPPLPEHPGRRHPK